MQLKQIARDALLKPLQAVSGLVERRHTLPILANVLIEPKDGALELTATDLEMQITALSECAAKAGAATTVSAQQDIRYYLNGMLLVIHRGSLQAVATDGHRLSWASLPVDGDFTRQEVILPRKTVLELGKLLTDSDDPVSIDVLASQVRFRFANVELVSKVVDGKFPDYNRVIPVGHTKSITLDRNVLLAALQRAAILANEKFRGVRLVLGPDHLKIICSNAEQEEAEEELEVAYKGEGLDIGFNITYLLGVLQNVDSAEVAFAFGDANSSALVTMPGRDDFKYVVMPMRI